MKRTTHSRRRILLLGVAMPLVLTAKPAQAIYFNPRMRVNRTGNRVRVRIWVSANAGPLNLNNHYLGAFYVPDGRTLRREFQVGVATIKMVMKVKNQVVEVVIKMLSAMFATQQKLMRASLAG